MNYWFCRKAILFTRKTENAKCHTEGKCHAEKRFIKLFSVVKRLKIIEGQTVSRDKNAQCKFLNVCFFSVPFLNTKESLVSISVDPKPSSFENFFGIIKLFHVK